MKIHSVSVKKASDKIYNQVFRLNFGDSGYMQSVLKDLRTSSNSMVRNGHIDFVGINGKVVGWSLIFDLNFRKMKHRVQYLYVEPSHRKKGIGTLLAQNGIKLNPTLEAHTSYTSCYTKAGIKTIDDTYLEHIKLHVLDDIY